MKILTIKEKNSFYYLPKFSAPDESTVIVGIKLHFRNKAGAIPEDIAAKLNHAGQHV